MNSIRLAALVIICVFVLSATAACAGTAASQSTSGLVILEAASTLPTPRPTSMPYPTATPAKTDAEITQGLSTSRFLDGLHARQGVQCEACHRGTSRQEMVTKEVCLTCHGGSYAALAERTSSLPMNPHRSHIGQVNCIYCHNVHSPFDYYCAQCHKRFSNNRFD